MRNMTSMFNPSNRPVRTVHTVLDGGKPIDLMLDKHGIYRKVDINDPATWPEPPQPDDPIWKRR